MVDSEGVTWAEMEIECPYLVLKIPIQPRLHAGQDRAKELSVRTAEFQLEHRAGDGTLIYRLVDHVDK